MALRRTTQANIPTHCCSLPLLLNVRRPFTLNSSINTRNIPCRPQVLIISNLIIVWIVAEHYKPFWRAWQTLLAKGLGADRTDAYVLAATLGALSLVFWPLYSSRMLPEENGKIMSGGSCWADLPIHMHIAESFLQVRVKRLFSVSTGSHGHSNIHLID